VDSDAGRWRDLARDGRLPRFALLCLGIWLNAADSLVTSTIMPSVAADIGGYEFFAWPVAAYLLGAIVAGASAGRLTEIVGLRAALFGAALVYAGGCVAGALAPGMAAFLAGRLLQGAGAGWIVGLVYGAVNAGFPKALWTRVLAAVSGVWGVATLLGPLLGGLFAEAGLWRMLFWLFASQAVAFAGATLLLVPRTRARDLPRKLPLARLVLLSLAVLLIGTAGIADRLVAAIAMIVAGLALLLLFVRLDKHASVSLMPPQLGDPASISGAGYLMMFLANVSSVGFVIYGAALLQKIYGLSPLASGYAIATEAMSWTVCALMVAGAPVRRQAFFIRLGASCILAGIALLGVAMPSGHLAFVIACAILLGAGFGLCWSFSIRRIFESLSDSERALGSSAVPAVQIVGGAVGAAIAGTIANLLGMTHGMDAAGALRIATWLFVALIPVAFLAWLSALRFSAPSRGDV